MTTKRLFLTTAIVSLFLIGFVGNRSEAFDIESMRSRNGIITYDNDGYILHIADVETDEPYYLVDWYVNGVQQDISFGDGEVTDASFCLPDPVSGSISGETYTIKAVAEPWEGEGSASRSYTVTVYDPIIVSGTKPKTGVWGYSRLSKQYLSGTSINVNCYIYASNSTNLIRTGTGRFKHEVRDPGGNVVDDPVEDQPVSTFGPGETYGPHYQDSLSVSIGNGDPDEQFTSKVYVRLGVRGQNNAGKAVEDEWRVSNTETFERQ